MSFITKLVNFFRLAVLPLPRGEIRFVSYAEGNRLLGSGEWKLAVPEEDNNQTIGMVYVEKIV